MSPISQEHGSPEKLSECHELWQNLCRRNQSTHVLRYPKLRYFDNFNFRVKSLTTAFFLNIFAYLRNKYQLTTGGKDCLIWHLCKHQNRHDFIQFKIGFFGKRNSTCVMNHQLHKKMIKASVQLQALSCCATAYDAGCCIPEHLKPLQVHNGLIELQSIEKIGSEPAFHSGQPDYCLTYHLNVILNTDSKP